VFGPQCGVGSQCVRKLRTARKAVGAWMISYIIMRDALRAT